MTDPKYLKPADVAALLSVSKPTVMKLARTRGLPFIQLGRVVRFEHGAVIEWMTQQQKKVG